MKSVLGVFWHLKQLAKQRPISPYKGKLASCWALLLLNWPHFFCQAFSGWYMVESLSTSTHRRTHTPMSFDMAM